MRWLNRPGSLRIRLVLLNVLIFGLLQAVVWLTASIAGSTIIKNRFQASLRTSAANIAGALESLDEGVVNGKLSDEAKSLLASRRSTDLFIQLRDRDGKVFWQSLKLQGVVLPPPERHGESILAPTLTEIESDGFGKILRDGTELDMVSMDVASTPAQHYTLQVAGDPSRPERAWEWMLSMLLAFVLISLLLSAIASWLIAGRYLAPLRSIADQAGSVTGQRLDQRVTIPNAAYEIAEVVGIMNQMLDRLERDFIAQRQFIANVSHELKTPLTVLLGEARKSMKQLESSGGDLDFAELVADEARRMFGIVEGFLILADAQIGTARDVAMPVDIEDVVLTAIGRARKAARRRDVRIVPMLSDEDVEVDPVVFGDFDLLESMVRNLLENAVRHSPESESVSVRVRPAGDGRHVDIVVRDHGPGIPEAHLDRVFDLFHQVTPNSNPTGTGGIGLAIVKAVAVKHGGTISVSNAHEGGCEFRVRLPLNRWDGAAPTSVDAPEHAAPSQST